MRGVDCVRLAIPWHAGAPGNKTASSLLIRSIDFVLTKVGSRLGYLIAQGAEYTLPQY